MKKYLSFAMFAVFSLAMNLNAQSDYETELLKQFHTISSEEIMKKP